MRKGWYIIPGVQDGDRTLDQQIAGLEEIDFRGKTVLELGCAEGLMSKWMIERGAMLVVGCDSVPGNVAEATRQCAGLPCYFGIQDISAHPLLSEGTLFDIVMALSILHKLRDPLSVASRLASFANRMIVVRLPPQHAPSVIAPISGNVPLDVGEALRQAGLELDRVTRGSFNEWTGHYVRRRRGN